MSKLRGLRGALAVAVFAVGAGSGTAALVPLGRPQLPIPSAEWALVAAVTGAALIGLFGIQTALIALIARRPLGDAVRATTGSFSPLLLLWPLLLGVTFSDTANHWFVYHPGVGLWWGGVGFVFAVAQIALLPVQSDGAFPLTGQWTWQAGFRRMVSDDLHPLVVIVVAYTLLRLTVRFAFETARFLDPKRPFELFYTLATLTDQGIYPYLHRWSEYPPGFPWLSAGVYRAVTFFGVTYERYYAAVTLALLPFGIGSLVLVYKLTERAWDRKRAVHASWGFAVLAVPMHDWMSRFTTVPVFCLLLAVYFVVAGRRHTAMLAAIVGSLFKIVPVAGAVFALRATSTWQSRLGLAAMGTAWLALGLVPFWIVGRPWFEAS